MVPYLLDSAKTPSKSCVLSTLRTPTLQSYIGQDVPIICGPHVSVPECASHVYPY